MGNTDTLTQEKINTAARLLEGGVGKGPHVIWMTPDQYQELTDEYWRATGRLPIRNPPPINKFGFLELPAPTEGKKHE